MANPGDWPCPNANCVNNQKLVFASKASCPKCGASRDDDSFFSEGRSGGEFGSPRVNGGVVGGDNPDDWQCPNQDCMNHTKMVFAKHSACPACGTARNAKQPGDWQCPNVNCVNNRNTVFASKVSCPKCGSLRPTRGVGGRAQPMPLPVMMNHRVRMHQPVMSHMGFRGGNFANTQFAMPMAMVQMPMRMPRMAQVQVPPSGNPMDWRCPSRDCVNNRRMVFAKHESCPQCGTPKPVGGSTGSIGRGGGGSNPADWQCPNQDCLNHKNKVFAKHSSCPSCGSPAPARSGRSRSPYRTA